MIDVSVREQDRYGLQAVFRDDFVQLGSHIRAWVHDHTLLAGAPGQDIAVGAKGSGWKAGYEHGNPPRRRFVWTSEPYRGTKDSQPPHAALDSTVALGPPTRRRGWDGPLDRWRKHGQQGSRTRREQAQARA